MTDSVAEEREKRVLDKFMIEEYKNISKAHFNLHSGMYQMFRFYLGVVAVPVTIFAFVYKDTAVNLDRLPPSLVYTLMIIAIIGFLMFLSLINIRFDTILYTRTVNGTRKYFADRAKNCKPEHFLLLPQDMNFPPYQENPTKSYWWQFVTVALINSIYLGVGVKNIDTWPVTILWGGALFISHVIIYYFLAWRRKVDTEKLIPRNQNP